MAAWRRPEQQRDGWGSKRMVEEDNSVEEAKATWRMVGKELGGAMAVFNFFTAVGFYAMTLKKFKHAASQY